MVGSSSLDGKTFALFWDGHDSLILVDSHSHVHAQNSIEKGMLVAKGSCEIPEQLGDLLLQIVPQNLEAINCQSRGMEVQLVVGSSWITPCSGQVNAASSNEDASMSAPVAGLHDQHGEHGSQEAAVDAAVDVPHGEPPPAIPEGEPAPVIPDADRASANPSPELLPEEQTICPKAKRPKLSRDELDHTMYQSIKSYLADHDILQIHKDKGSLAELKDWALSMYREVTGRAGGAKRFASVYQGVLEEKEKELAKAPAVKDFEARKTVLELMSVAACLVPDNHGDDHQFNQALAIARKMMDNIAAEKGQGALDETLLVGPWPWLGGREGMALFESRGSCLKGERQQG